MFKVIIGILIWIAIIAVFYFFTNKFKYNGIFSKIIILAIIAFSFYMIFTNGFTHLGIIKGAFILGLTWGLIFAVHCEYILRFFSTLVITCLAGWLVSFILGCLEFANIPFESSIKVAALIGLGISAISAIFSSGEFFSFVDYDNYFSDSNSSSSDNETKKDRKITAETFHFGKHLSTTTYRDEDGNETKVDHWNWN